MRKCTNIATKMIDYEQDGVIVTVRACGRHNKVDWEKEDIDVKV